MIIIPASSCNSAAVAVIIVAFAINENARIIADKAGALYDKIRGFVEDLDKLGTQLSTVNKTYEGVMNKLTLGQGNLIRQASSFVELGVKVKKTIPKKISEQATLEDEES